MLQFISQQQREATFKESIKQYRQLSDRLLITKILNGNTYLFKLLVQRHNNRLYRMIHSYTSDEEAIKDILQQTYMKAYENLDSWRGSAQFGTWITRIAINEALKYLNRQKRYSDLHNENLNSGEETALTGTSDNTPEDETIRQDLEKVLRQAVDTLSSKYRKVFINREMENMSTTRTAEQLGISTSNVKVRLHRARKKLRQTLKQQMAEPGGLYK